jgi:hypothetical protein
LLRFASIAARSPRFAVTYRLHLNRANADSRRLTAAPDRRHLMLLEDAEMSCRPIEESLSSG